MHFHVADWLAGASALQVLALAAAAACAWLAWRRLRGSVSNAVLLDFQCYAIPPELNIDRNEWIAAARKVPGIKFTADSWEFQAKVVERSGISSATSAIHGAHAMLNNDFSQMGHNGAQAETERIIYDIAEKLLEKTGIAPSEIGVVMTSCSCFVPQPSMASMLVNRLGLRPDVKTYNLSGMGCASSLICVDLARHLLAALPNTLVLIVNHENLTANWYNGNDKSMLVCNCLFRQGGAAALMSNRPVDAGRAKYRLQTSLRTHMGNEDEAFLCMGVGEDADGLRGVFLRKTVISVAGRAMTKHLTALGPRVLPLAEMVKYALRLRAAPDFGKAFDHFLLHTGGRGVIDSMEEHLGLDKAQTQPSRDTLWRFGNTSAASTWYILARIESQAGLRAGDRVWQLGFGGGFKCNSAVWHAIKDVREEHECWK